MKYDFDLFVIGAGSGGVRAARLAAQKGIKVAIAESTALGGTCVNLGCIPKKLFVCASHFSEEFDAAQGYGWFLAGKPAFNWQKLIENKNKEIERLNQVYETLLVSLGAKIVQGRAKIRTPHTVDVEGMTYTAERILVATGSRAYVPQFPGSNYVMTSDQAFHLQTLPKRILVVGGGYIAIEFAGIFNGLGVETYQLHRKASFLKNFDEETIQFLKTEVERKGVQLLFNLEVKAIEKRESGLQVQLSNNDLLEVDQVLYATGRRPNVEHLGFETIGVRLDKRNAIEVNEQFQTSVPSVYAIGDVINRVQLTPVALAEAMVFVSAVYDKKTVTIDYDMIPTAVFCQPNLAVVGLTEEKAKQSYGQIQVFKTDFRSLKLSLTESHERTFMKLIVDRASDKVVGAHMVGTDAGEIIQGIAVALKAGATKTLFDSTLGIHPTLAEEFVTMRKAVL